MKQKVGKKKHSRHLSPAEKAFQKLQADHKSAVRSVFRSAGFRRIPGIADKSFTFDNQTTDVDDIFVFENIYIIAEYTCAKASEVGGHLKNKKIIYDKIIASNHTFIDFLKSEFPDASAALTSSYHHSKRILRILYCSRHSFDDVYKTNVPGPIYMDYPALKYFVTIGDAIKLSCRYELLDYLKVDSQSIGAGGSIIIGSSSKEYKGSILPEAHSHFENGFKVVTFYADPAALLKTAYVLRKDGWQASVNLYQRMISKQKIESIRRYLKVQKRVFINNVIVTLPPDVRPVNSRSETVDASTLNETAPVIIKLPDRPSSICIIDGQHRVFAYHETSNDDQEIAQLRRQQNLLVTGVIYPNDINTIDREKFEARLFLEINSTQTSAKSPLKQAINVILEPFSSESIAARVLSGKTGALSGFIELYFFDSDKLKTASIVSYGLKPLVKPGGDDSLFSIWTNPRKSDMAKEEDSALLGEYVSFCVTVINRVLGSIRKNIFKERWTTEKRVQNRVLSTTYVNSFFIVMRILIEKKKSLEFSYLNASFSNINTFEFSSYRSSQYKRMAEEIVDRYF